MGEASAARKLKAATEARHVQSPSGPSLSKSASHTRGSAAEDQRRQRIGELRALEILDTPSDPRFDALVELCAELLNVPVVLLAFYDEERVWVKAAVGAKRGAYSQGVLDCEASSWSRLDLEPPGQARSGGRALRLEGIEYPFHAAAPLVTKAGVTVGCLIVAS